MTTFLIKICAYCHVQTGKVPATAALYKNLPIKYHGKDLFTHGICDSCLKKHFGVELNKAACGH